MILEVPGIIDKWVGMDGLMTAVSYQRMDFIHPNRSDRINNGQSSFYYDQDNFYFPHHFSSYITTTATAITATIIQDTSKVK